MTDRRKDTIMGTFGDNSPCMRDALRLANSLRQMADGKHFDPDELYSAAALIEEELPSRSEMVSLVAAIIQDEAKYDTTTNTWDVERAANSIVTAFEAA